MISDQVFLFIGPRFNKKNDEKIGGVVVLFEDLLHYCDSKNIKYIVIDTNKENYMNQLVAYINIILQIIAKVPNVSYVSLHGTSSDYLFIAPLALLIAKLFKRPFSLRKFGGNFIDLFINYPRIGQAVIKIILKNSKINFFETKYLVKYFSKYNENTYWFPNVRLRQIVPILPRSYAKRFVFISQVRKLKGMQEILEASKIINQNYTIDIYGPLFDHYTIEYFNKYPNVRYKGSLKSEKVLSEINKYDVLLLPSYQEGYPGIVLEAYSVGIPVITTNLEGICEIVDEYQTGILVEPGNTKQLVDAIKYFNADNYEQMSYKAYKKFDEFDSSKITKGFIDNVINK